MIKKYNNIPITYILFCLLGFIYRGHLIDAYNKGTLTRHSWIIPRTVELWSTWIRVSCYRTRTVSIVYTCNT